MSNIESSPVNQIAVDESKVRTLAEQAIESTCARHNVSRDKLTDEAIADAYSSARARVAHEQELSQDQGYQALQAEREKNRLLQLQVEALRQIQPVRNEAGNAGHARSSTLPHSEVVRARLGDAAWGQLTIEGRLAACGVPPAEVTAATREEAQSLFGRNPDSKRANDLYRTSPNRYKTLKTVASILGITGK